MITRTSTYGMSAQNVANINARQKNIQDLTMAISSGKNDNRYEGLALDSNRLVNLENELERIDRYRDNIDTATRRLNETENSLASLIDMGTKFKAAMLQASNDPSKLDVPLSTMARDFYESAAAFLNKQQDERYIFSGSETDIPPVRSLEQVQDMFRTQVTAGTISLNTGDLAYDGVVNSTGDENGSMAVRTMQVIDFFTNGQEYNTTSGYPTAQEPNTYLGTANESNYTLGDPPAQLDFSSLYYQGDDKQLSARTEDNFDVSYGITADRTGIEKMMTAAFLVADWQPQDTASGLAYNATGDMLDNETKLDAATKLMGDALSDAQEDNLTQIRSEVGLTVNKFQRSEERHKTMELYIEGVVTEIENTDVAEAATHLADQRMILESSFLAISSLSQLSLANYLR